MTTPRELIIARILRWTLYAMAFVPLIIFTDTLGPYSLGKAVIFRSVIQLALPFYLVLLWQDRSYAPKMHAIFWAVLGLAAVFSVAGALSVNPHLSMWGNLERMGGVFMLWHYVFFFLMLTGLLRNREQWDFFVMLLVAAGLLSTLFGFGQKYLPKEAFWGGGTARMIGTVGNAALFGGYQLLTFFLALTLAVRSVAGSGKQIFYLSAVFLGGIAIILTAVRGSFAGLGIGLLVFLVLYYRGLGGPKVRIAFFAFLGLMVIYLGVALTPLRNLAIVQDSPFLSRMTDLSPKSFTLQQRFWLWRAAISGWRENTKTLLIGWGPETFNIPFSRNFNPEFFQSLTAETIFDRSHNMFVEALVSTGIAGFVANIALLAVLFFAAVKISRKKSADRTDGIGMIALLVAYIVHNSFIFDSECSYIVLFSAFGFLAFLSVPAPVADKKEKKPAAVRTRQFGPVQTFAAMFLVVFALVLVYQTNVLYVRAASSAAKARAIGSAGRFPQMLQEFKHALEFGVPMRYEIRNMTSGFLFSWAGQENGQTPEIAEAFSYMTGEAQKNIDENPQDYLSELYVGRLNQLMGMYDPKSPQNDQALRHYMRALELAPNFVRTYYEIAEAYFNKEDYPKSVEYFEKAVALSPEVGSSHWRLGEVLIWAGKKDDAVRELNTAKEKGYVPSVTDYYNVMAAYAWTKDTDSAIRVYLENIIPLEPDNAMNYARLAMLYAQTGNFDDAIAMVEKAKTLDPQFAVQGDKFIEQMRADQKRMKGEFSGTGEIPDSVDGIPPEIMAQLKAQAAQKKDGQPSAPSISIPGVPTDIMQQLQKQMPSPTP